MSNAKKRDSTQQVGADRRNSGDTASIRNKKLASYLEDDACDEAFERAIAGHKKGHDEKDSRSLSNDSFLKYSQHKSHRSLFTKQMSSDEK